MKILTLIFLLIPGSNSPGGNINDLINIAYCDDFWVKVHAIEYLVDLNYKKEACLLIDKELKPFGSTNEKRIGYWRLKYQTSEKIKEKAYWLEKIKRAYKARDGKDRIHAVETLAKLNFPLSSLEEDDLIEQDLKNPESQIYSFVLWGKTVPEKDSEADFSYLINELGKAEPQRRRLSAYALSFFPSLPEGARIQIAEKALAEPIVSEAKAYMLSTAYMWLAYDTYNRSLFEKLKEELLIFKNSNNKSDRVAVCRALAIHADERGLEVLDSLINGDNIIKNVNDEKIESDHPVNLDVRAAAIYARLKNN